MKAITVKWHGYTDTKPGRFIARDSDGNRFVGTASMIEDEVVIGLCRKMGWTGILDKGDLKRGQRVYVWRGKGLAVTK